MDEKVVVGGQEYALDRAKRVISGYCFSQWEEEWDPPRKQFGTLPPNLSRSRWAYRTYDCVPSSQGPELDPIDLLSPIGLNVTQGYGSPLFGRLLSVAPLVSDAMSGVGGDETFWGLRRQEIDPVGRPAPDSTSMALHRAWFLMESVPGVGLTIAHKILHHKWPKLFPLLDRSTEPYLAPNLWIAVLDDLQSQPATFQHLEDWFSLVATMHACVPLTRLRLHDLLLWCRASDEEDEAASRGEQYL